MSVTARILIVAFLGFLSQGLVLTLGSDFMVSPPSIPGLAEFLLHSAYVVLDRVCHCPFDSLQC